MTITSNKQFDQLRIGRLAVGAIGMVIAVGYLINALDIPFGTPRTPGPGMFPVGVGIAAIIISLIVVCEAIFEKDTEEQLELPRGKQAKDVLVFLAATVVYVLLLPVLGQYVTSTLYMLSLLILLSSLTWWKIMLYSLLGGAGVSWAFIEGFGVRMPGGLF